MLDLLITFVVMFSAVRVCWGSGCFKERKVKTQLGKLEIIPEPSQPIFSVLFFLGIKKGERKNFIFWSLFASS
jgi:hypothetical protein